MQASFDNIVQQLFHQPSLHSVSVDELEQMARQHPYFAAAHFLLLKKMQDTAHPDFTAQLHKTTIYFNNPLWLQFLLQPETVTNFTVSETTPFITSEPVTVEEGTSNGYAPENVPEINEPTVQDPLAAAGQHTDPGDTNSSVHDEDKAMVPAEQDNMMDIITEVFSDPNPLYSPTVEPAGTISTEEIPQPADEPIYHSEAFEDNISPGEPAIEEINTGMEDIPQHLADKSAPTAEIETTAAPVHGESIAIAGEEKNSDDVPETFPENDHTIETASETIPLPDESSTAESTGTNQQEIPAALTTDEQPASELPAGEQDANIISETAMGETNNEPVLIKPIMETPVTKNDLLFEPYHTVDYFASQGIKLSKMEAEGKDKLTRQLKSFTEWLKTMKKLPQVSIDKILAENEESKVVEDANHSLENKEVVTEAMAEVFEKQGMYEKAAGIYEKLSLQNPAKSAYFAARMEALKH